MDGGRHIFPASKKINIGATASLGDLKAELLKRKAEAEASKQKNANTPAPGKEKWQTVANKLQDNSSEKKHGKQQKLPHKPKDEAAIELERQLMLSRESLERKAKLYEQRYNQAKAGLVKGNDSSSDEEWDSENGPNSLVDFREKIRLKIEMPRPRTPSPVPIALAQDDDYVEFTDSFGRTRKCLKKNLSHYKKMDEEAKLVARTDNKEAGDEEEEEQDTRTWEEVKPVGPVRYQVLVQDEVRDHGVGFFRFSDDEDLRKQQLQTLADIHKETMKQRKLARIRKRAERNERRAKQAHDQGVPIESIPEEPSSDEEESLPESFDELSERDKEALALKELLTREWDEGKRDAMGRLVPELSSSSARKRVTAQMASKAITDERRQEREAEFAPPSSYFDSPVPNRTFNAFPATKKMKESDSSEKDIDKIISEKLAHFKNRV